MGSRSAELTVSASRPPARLPARPLSLTLREGRRGAVGTCSGGTNYGEASGGRCGAVAGLHVFRDAAVRGQLMAEGRAELRELLLGLRGGQGVVRGGRGGGRRREARHGARGHGRERRHGLQRDRVGGGGGGRGQRGGDEMTFRADEVAELRRVGEGEREVVPRGARGPRRHPAEGHFQQQGRGVRLEGAGVGRRYLVTVGRWHVLAAVLAALRGRGGRVRLG